jgi:hypothetical protein
MKKTYLISVDVVQRFTNSFDIEAASEEAAIKKAIKMCKNIRICRAYTSGYLQDNKNISPYWRPTEDISVIKTQIED